MSKCQYELPMSGDQLLGLLKKIQQLGLATYDEDGLMSHCDKRKLDSINIYYNTTLYWNAQHGYIPEAGSIIIYSDYKTTTIDGVDKTIPGIKIGSGNGYVQDLVFVNDFQSELLWEHINNTEIHITPQERAFWNNKSDFSGSYTDLTDKPDIPTDAVRYTQQTLTEEQQAQARENIGVEGTGIDTEAVHYTPQSLTDAQKAQARTNIGATAPEVFVAIYGTTTYAEVTTAISDGKVVVVKRVIDAETADESVAFYGGLQELFGIYFFSRLIFTLQGAASDLIGLDQSGWSAVGIEYFEDTANKVSSWSATPNDSSYPSEKLVKDSLDGKQPTIDASHKLDYSLLSNTPDLSGFITASVNNLVNYYLKSETYTQAEVNALIGAISQFHYEIAASTSVVSSPANNVLYLIGPTGSGADKYEEYVYPNSTQGWVKIGDTSIDLSGYVTTQAFNTALSDYTVTSSLASVALSGSYNDLLNKPTIPAAQVNADWNASSGVAQILNKPTLGTASAKNVPSTGNAGSSEVVLGNDTRLSDSRPASDVSSWAKASTKPTYNYSEIQNTPTIPAAGIPSGGSSGQVLKKSSGTDYDVAWANESGAVTDVTVGGTSVVSNGVAAIPAIPAVEAMTNTEIDSAVNTAWV